MAMPKYTFVFSNPNAYATTLISAILAEYGTEALEWEPLTIEAEIKQDQRLSSIPDIVMDKIQAAMVLLTTNQFYQYYEAFENIGRAFCGDIPDFTILTPLSPEEAAWSLLEARLIDPQEEPTGDVFSGEVQGYLRAILDSAGICTPPEIFTSAGVSTGIEACSHFPELREDIEREQELKKLRIKAYLIHRYDQLASEMSLVFGRRVPSLSHLLENRLAAASNKGV